MTTQVTTTQEKLRVLRTASTLCLIIQASGISLAHWCPDWKRWLYYSNGYFVKGEVTSFFPLFAAEWLMPIGNKAGHPLCVVQLDTGRYILAYPSHDGWVSKKTGRKIPETVLRFVRVEKLKAGSFKDV